MDKNLGAYVSKTWLKKSESTKIIQPLNFCLESYGDMLTIYMHTKKKGLRENISKCQQ